LAHPISIHNTYKTILTFDCGFIAGLLIAMVEGYASLAKNAQDPKVMKAGIRNIVGWLRSLRAPGNRKRV